MRLIGFNSARFTTSGSRSSVTTVKLVNFYDFRNWKDVTRYKMRLQDGLLSTGSTRLPRATVTQTVRIGLTNCDANCANDSTK